MAQAAGMTSIPSWGAEPWPLLPLTVREKKPQPLMRTPGCTLTAPQGRLGATWTAKAVSTPSSIPASSRARPAPANSSAGSNTSRTRPGRASRSSHSRAAAPSSMAVWASWPQACITPGTREAKGRPVASWMGRASMSARSSTVGPGRPPEISATTPVSPTIWKGMDRADSSSCTRRLVSTP